VHLPEMSREGVVYRGVAGGGVDLRYSPELSDFPEKLPLPSFRRFAEERGSHVHLCEYHN
jgi:hypothetical protein